MSCAAHEASLWQQVMCSGRRRSVQSAQASATERDIFVLLVGADGYVTRMCCDAGADAHVRFVLCML